MSCIIITMHYLQSYGYNVNGMEGDSIAFGEKKCWIGKNRCEPIEWIKEKRKPSSDDVQT